MELSILATPVARKTEKLTIIEVLTGPELSPAGTVVLSCSVLLKISLISGTPTVTFTITVEVASPVIFAFKSYKNPAEEKGTKISTTNKIAKRKIFPTPFVIFA